MSQPDRLFVLSAWGKVVVLKITPVPVGQFVVGGKKIAFGAGEGGRRPFDGMGWSGLVSSFFFFQTLRRGGEGSGAGAVLQLPASVRAASAAAGEEAFIHLWNSVQGSPRALCITADQPTDYGPEVTYHCSYRTRGRKEVAPRVEVEVEDLGGQPASHGARVACGQPSISLIWKKQRRRHAINPIPQRSSTRKLRTILPRCTYTHY